MIILDVTIPTLGRFEVLDDFTIRDFDLNTEVTERELETLSEYMRVRHTFGTTYSECLLSAMASLYGMPAEMVTWHARNEPLVMVEPEQEPETV